MKWNYPMPVTKREVELLERQADNVELQREFLLSDLRRIVNRLEAGAAVEPGVETLLARLFIHQGDGLRPPLARPVLTMHRRARTGGLERGTGTK